MLLEDPDRLAGERLGVERRVGPRLAPQRN